MLLLQENWPTRPRVRSCFSFKCDCKMPWVMISCLKYCLSNAKYLLNIPAWNFKSCSFYSTKPFQLSSSFEIIVQISDIHISKIWSKQDAWNCLTKSPTREEANHLRKVIIIISDGLNYVQSLMFDCQRPKIGCSSLITKRWTRWSLFWY